MAMAHSLNLDSSSAISKIFSPFCSLSRWDKGAGTVEIGCFAWSSYCLFKSSRTVSKLVRERPAGAPNSPQFFEEVRKAAYNAFSWITSSASLALWGGRVKIISLGKFASLVHKISFTSYIFTSGLGIVKAVKDIAKEKKALLTAVDFKEKSKHAGYLKLAWVDLAGEVATLAWAILGLISIATGAIALTSFSITFLLFMSCGFGCASFAYDVHLFFKHTPLPKPVVS